MPGLRITGSTGVGPGAPTPPLLSGPIQGANTQVAESGTTVGSYATAMSQHAAQNIAIALGNVNPGGIGGPASISSLVLQSHAAQIDARVTASTALTGPGWMGSSFTPAAAANNGGGLRALMDHAAQIDARVANSMSGSGGGSGALVSTGGGNVGGASGGIMAQFAAQMIARAMASTGGGSAGGGNWGGGTWGGGTAPPGGPYGFGGNWFGLGRAFSPGNTTGWGVGGGGVPPPPPPFGGGGANAGPPPGPGPGGGWGGGAAPPGWGGGPPPFAGGGNFGGGGGNWGWGGGWAQGAQVAAGHVGFGGLAGAAGMMRMAAMGGGLGLAAGALAVGTYETLKLPSTYGHIASVIGGEMQPYVDLSRSAASLGIAGGFNSTDLVNQFFPGNMAGHALGRSPVLEGTGYGPNDAAGMLSRFGIVPHGVLNISRNYMQGGIPADNINNPAYEAGQLGGLLASTRTMSGLSQLPEGMANASAATMARYGVDNASQLGSSTATAKYLGDLATVMQGAVARGMDSASILRSIDASVSMSARAGSAGPNPMADAAWLMKFSDLPGGKTGEVGMAVSQQVQARGDLYGQDPLVTFNTASTAMRVGGSEASLREYINKNVPTPEGYASAYDQMSSVKGWSDVRKDLEGAVKAGNTTVAGKLLHDLSIGRQELVQANVSNDRITQGLTGPLSYMSHVTGGALVGMSSVNYAIQQRGASELPAGRGGVPGGPIGNLFEESKVGQYRTSLKNMGMPPDMIEATLVGARNRGEDPLMLGKIAYAESNFGKTPGKGPGGIGAYGLTSEQNPWQITQGSGRPQPHSLAEGATSAAIVLHDARVKYGNSDAQITRGYTGGLGPGEEASYLRRLNTATGAAQLPQGTAEREEAIKQAAMLGSSNQFWFAAAVVGINDATNGVIGALTNFNSVLNNAAAASTQGAPGTMSGAGMQ